MLNKILNEFEWTNMGISHDSPALVRRAHEFMRKLILDRHLYLNKVIGFKFVTSITAPSNGTTNIARNIAIGESYLEVMAYLDKKIYLDSKAKSATVQLALGPNTVHNTITVNPEKQKIELLHETDELCRVLDGTARLELYLAYDCVYRSAQRNSKVVGKDYWPCETDYSVQDYFRVLPDFRNPHLVRINYYNGATPEILKRLLIDYKDHRSVLKKGESLWLSNYDL